MNSKRAAFLETTLTHLASGISQKLVTKQCRIQGISGLGEQGGWVWAFREQKVEPMRLR